MAELNYYSFPVQGQYESYLESGKMNVTMEAPTFDAELNVWFIKIKLNDFLVAKFAVSHLWHFMKYNLIDLPTDNIDRYVRRDREEAIAAKMHSTIMR